MIDYLYTDKKDKDMCILKTMTPYLYPYVYVPIIESMNHKNVKDSGSENKINSDVRNNNINGNINNNSNKYNNSQNKISDQNKYNNMNKNNCDEKNVESIGDTHLNGTDDIKVVCMEEEEEDTKEEKGRKGQKSDGRGDGKAKEKKKNMLGRKKNTTSSKSTHRAEGLTRLDSSRKNSCPSKSATRFCSRGLTLTPSTKSIGKICFEQIIILLGFLQVIVVINIHLVF